MDEHVTNKCKKDAEEYTDLLDYQVIFKAGYEKGYNYGRHRYGAGFHYWKKKAESKLRVIKRLQEELKLAKGEKPFLDKLHEQRQTIHALTRELEKIQLQDPFYKKCHDADKCL